jgi:hypothetical protein
VTDLSVVQRGDRLLIRFTAPALTTEDLGIRSFSRADVRAGAVVQPFSMESWESAATVVTAPVPEPGGVATAEAPVAAWRDREVLVAVRLVSTRGREADWSNPVTLTPRAPLPVPAVIAAPHAEGVQVRWPAAQGAKYRVRRQAEGAAEPVEVATVDEPVYMDKAVDIGKSYTYNVQSFAGLIESEVSSPVRVTMRDEFAPKPPSGLTVVAGLNSIELVWERNAESDLGGYRVHRAEGSAEFIVLADAVEAVAYSDRQVEPGGTYRYRVTALDKSGNESESSLTVEATTAK